MFESGETNGGGAGGWRLGRIGEFQGMPPRTGLFIKIGLAALALILLFLVLNLGRGIYTNWLWFSQLGFRSVYTTILTTKIWLFFAGFITMAALTVLSFRYAYRNSWGPVQYPMPPEAVVWLRRALIASIVIVGAIIAIVFGTVLAGRWNDFLRLLNSVSFDMQDPLFNKDVGFYVFTMPALHMVQGWLMGAFIVLLIFSAAIYLAAYTLRGVNPELTPQLRTHLALLGAGFMLTIAAAHLLDIYEMLFSTSGTVTGATFADVTARLPALRLLTGVAALSAIIMLVSIRLKNLRQAMRLLLIALGLWVVAALLAGAAWPALVQRFSVDPNELERERLYIDRNIEWTRIGFDLNRVNLEPYPVREELQPSDLLDNPETVNNIRLWDPRPLLDAYNQIQHLRLYYNFSDVDVDRYTVNGDYRQVLLGTRELFPEGLDPAAQNWVNRKLVYTHGYGVVVSPATEFTEEGQPEFYIKDVPPTGILTVNQPRIYYGENTTDFVVVSTREPEFDHPAIEEGAQPVYISSYDGLGGVRLSSFLRRLAYAWEFADINVLISSQITGESRTLYRRAISERVSTVAPFLSLDQDPYMVVTEDGLFWIQDAYTTTDRFPYSKRLDEQDFNYIRNSVKVVLDAYNGSLTFYIIEPGGRRDPLVRVYQQIFPDLFRPIEEMPLSLQSHIRYPEVLLRAQAQTYLQYHMIDSKEFFLKEDQWEIPNEVVLEGISQPVEPYYVIMKLRGEEREEFVLILPFTPQDKPNLVAWMAARSDGEHYGDILAFRFPKDRLFNGPSQIEARIDNDPKISEQFTLWGQSGSIVIRGNLLVIPIGETLLYAEPIYLQAETLDFPELKRVILVTSDQVVMEPTLQESVFALLGRTPPTVRTPIAGGGEPLPDGITALQLKEGLQRLQEALDALRGGLDEVDESLEGLQELTEESAP